MSDNKKTIIKKSSEIEEFSERFLKEMKDFFREKIN